MTVINYYRVYDTVLLQYEYLWSLTTPVLSKSGNPIDANLTVILDTVSNNDVKVINLPPRDAFGTLQTTGIFPIFQAIFTYGLPAQKFSQSSTGSGTITTANQLCSVNSGAASSSSAKISSLKNIKYSAGQGILARFTGLFTSGVVGNTQKIGLLSDTDGLGFGYNGVDFGIFYRNNSVDTWIPQNTWNLDPMNGNGPSGTNIDFSLGFGNVFEIQLQYLGFGNLLFFVEDPKTGLFTKVHTIEYANSATVPSFLIPSFPLSLESVNTTNTTDISVKAGSLMAAIEGEYIISGARFQDSMVGISTSAGSETEAGSWLVTSTFNGIPNRINVYATEFSTVSGVNDRPQIMRFYKGGTFTTPTWTDVSAGQSCMQRLTGGNWDSNGVKLFEIYIPGGGNALNYKFELDEGGNLLGVGGDTFTITFQSLSGNGTVDSVINWLEDS